MKFTTFCTFVLISSPLYAKNYALFFSGVDSREGNENIFLEEYKKQNTLFNKAGWESKILYGDEKESKHLMKAVPKLAGKVKTATKDNIFEYLDNLIKNAESGDQALLSLNGHGSDGSFGIEGESLKYSDPALLERLKKLNDKGIKLAITMDTCYGGSALPHFSPYACVVSSQTNNSVSYGGPVQTSFKKIFEQTQPKNMNDYYLQMLAEATTVPRMIPMSSASNDADYLARITTGLYRRDGKNPSEPDALCYGPKAIEHFAEGFAPITKMLNADAKYKKICKVFGPDKCLKQSALAASLQKMDIGSIDEQTERLEGLSDARLKTLSDCSDADDTFEKKSFKMNVDYKNILIDPKDTSPLEWIANNNNDVTPGVSFNEPTKSGMKRTYAISGSMCEIAELISPASISRMAKAYAKSMFIGPDYMLKAKSEAELAAKIKVSLTNAMAKMLTKEQKAKLELNQEVISEYKIASQNYTKANVKLKADLGKLQIAKINQGLAYKFLDEADHVAEKDKAGRKKCQDFKLK